MELAIEIKHRLKNRFRINFSNPIQDFEKLKFQIMEHPGLETFEYTPLTQNLLIEFDEEIVQAQEVLIRTAVAYSMENNLSPIKISQKAKQEFITAKGMFSGLSILAALVMNYTSKNEAFKKAISWIGAATTAAAVIEHAAFDYRKKGSVDPEVLSLGLLVNSIVNNQKILMPSALTWISTFGRHFSSNDTEGILLEVTKKKEEGDKAYYHIHVSKLTNKGNIADLFYHLAEGIIKPDGGFNNAIFEGARDAMNSHDEFMEGMGEKINGMVLHFHQ